MHGHCQLLNKTKHNETCPFEFVFYIHKEKKKHYENVNIFSVSLLALQTLNVRLSVNITTKVLSLISLCFKHYFSKPLTNTKTKHKHTG